MVPKSGSNDALDDETLDTFEVVFALPQEDRPITIQCQGRRIFQTQDSYQALQSYLY